MDVVSANVCKHHRYVKAKPARSPRLWLPIISLLWVFGSSIHQAEAGVAFLECVGFDFQLNKSGAQQPYGSEVTEYVELYLAEEGGGISKVRLPNLYNREFGTSDLEIHNPRIVGKYSSTMLNKSKQKTSFFLNRVSGEISYDFQNYNEDGTLGDGFGFKGKCKPRKMLF
jgi:hypothetical protein